MAFASCSYVAATYQPKLKDCNGADLPAGTEMATCADLAGLSIADATDTTKGKVALNAGTSLPADATNCTDALTACGLNALLTDPAAGGNTVITNVKALIPLATTTVPGLIEEATGEETRLGATDANRADRAVTPESMSYALQTGKDYPITVKTSADPYKRAVFGYLDSGTVSTVQYSGAVGVLGYVTDGVTTPATFRSSATTGENQGIGTGEKVGVSGMSGGAGGTNIGVYGTAANGATNWAGYFDGNTFTSGTARIGSRAIVTTFADLAVFQTNDPVNERVFIGGKIGVESPHIQISGSANANAGNAGGITYTTYNGSASGYGTHIFTGNVSTNSGAGNFNFATNTCTASSYVTSSDETLKENVEAIDAAKALQFRNGLQWKKYELFSESQEQIMEEVTEEVQKTDAAGNPVVDADGNPVMETLTTQVPTGRYEVKRNSQGIKRGLIAQEVQALAASIGDFSDVVVEVGEYFTLDAQGYPVKDAQGNNIVNKRLGLDYDAVSFIVMCAEQSLLIPA